MKTLSVEGELTIFTAAEQKASLISFLTSDDQLELNLANVEEIDTAGLQVLILLKREASRLGKTLSFVMHSAPVLEILELANLTTVFGDQVVISHA